MTTKEKHYVNIGRLLPTLVSASIFSVCTGNNWGGTASKQNGRCR